MDTQRLTFTREVRPTPDFLLHTDHFWVLAGEHGAASFEVSHMFNGPEGQPIWGDAWIRTHELREGMHESLEILGGGLHEGCPVLEGECWSWLYSGFGVSLDWQKAGRDDEIIFARLQEFYDNDLRVP